METYSFESFIDSLFSEIENMPVNKFIVDIRLNRGGSSSIIEPLYEKLAEHNELKGKIYCCIGAATFSSGELAAIYFKENLNAIMIGEPTGAKPNHYGEIKTFELPNSGYLVQYSTRYVAYYGDDNVETLLPDYFVMNYSYDSFNGIDSYVEFIKNNWP
jgi:C-terminal processing protease CtpA/Prc